MLALQVAIMAEGGSAYDARAFDENMEKVGLRP